MCKKVLIAALAVVVGLAVVKGTWFGSHIKARFCKAVQQIKESVPPEQEIARLRMELKGLERDDDKHYDTVARMVVQVDKMDRDVAARRTNLSREEARIKKLRGELADGVEFVVHQGTRYTRDDLRADALTFKTAEDSLQALESNLQAKKKHLALERKKLTELRTTREQMATELQRLETALAEERHAQAAAESTIDDSGYQRVRGDMEAVKERLEVLKTKRVLRGELKISTPDDKVRERDTQADKYLDTLSGKAEKEIVDRK